MALIQTRGHVFDISELENYYPPKWQTLSLWHLYVFSSIVMSRKDRFPVASSRWSSLSQRLPGQFGLQGVSVYPVHPTPVCTHALTRTVSLGVFFHPHRTFSMLGLTYLYICNFHTNHWQRLLSWTTGSHPYAAGQRVRQVFPGEKSELVSIHLCYSVLI